MAWECEYCYKILDSKKECSEHEKKCQKEYEKKRKDNIKQNILISKWIIFGVMLLFGIFIFSYRWLFASLGIVVALFFMPPMENFLSKKYKFNVHFVIKCLVLFLFFVLFIWTVPTCGDNSCNGNEDSLSCFSDCGSVCGDGRCNGEETSCNCVEDCGVCVSGGNTCEQAVCEGDKCVVSIEDNCCGNGIIESGETCLSCTLDVKCLNGEVCSNQECVELDWSCSDWSGCNKEGTQTRKCIEKNGLSSGKPKESQNCEYIPSIGDKIIVGNFEYFFKGLEEEEYIGDTYFVNEANGVFYILEFEITNVGKEADIIPLSQILIVDSEGREYSYDSSSSYSLYDGISSYEQLNPGISISGRMAYDVPEGLVGELKVGDGDLWEPQYKLFKFD